MALSTPYAIHFDVEILRDGDPLKDSDGIISRRYLNRGTDVSFGYSPRSHTDIYCLPGISYRLDPTAAIDDAHAQYRSTEREDISYIFSKDNILWDFGDGTTSQKLIPEKEFNTPGSYNIRLTLFDLNGQPRENPYSFQLTIKNYYPDKFNWISDNYSNFGLEYTKNSQGIPLTLHRINSWQTPEAYSTLSVYASASDSIPGTPSTYNNNKFAHFQKLWRFTEDITDPVPVETVTTDNTNIQVSLEFLPVDGHKESTYYSLIQNSSINNSETISVATSGAAQFYYVDDSAKNYLSRDVEPVFLFAAANRDTSPITSTHGLEQDVDVLPIKIMYETCDDIQISTNGMKSFPLQSVKYTNSINNINVSAVSTDNLISKSDYPELRLKPSSDTTPLDPFDVRFSVIDPVSGYDNSNLEVTTKTFPSDLPLNGSGSFIITPKAKTSNQAKLRTEVYIADPIYCPLETRAYVLTSMFSEHVHIMQPIIAGGAGSSWKTLKDNTMDSNISTTAISYDSASHNVSNAEMNEAFPVCVDPRSVHIYVGDTKRDTIVKMDRHANRLNHGDPINISKLLCQSDLVVSHNPNCSGLISPEHPLDSSTESSLLSGLYSHAPDEMPVGFESTDTDCEDFVDYGATTGQSLSPSSISCDSTGDIWVTLIDGVVTIKIHPEEDGSHSVTALAIPRISGSDIDSLLKTTSSGERLYMPSRVETDKNDNIWVSYTNREHVALRLYNSSGCEISSYIFDSSDGVQLDDMFVDASNDLWVTNSSYTPPGDPNGGSVMCVSTHEDDSIYIKREFKTYIKQGIEIEFDKPSHITSDLSGDLYISTGCNDVVKINPGTSTATYEFQCGRQWVENPDRVEVSGHHMAIDAMSCNSDNKLLIVNNVDKKLYVYDPEDSYSIITSEDFSEYSQSRLSSQFPNADSSSLDISPIDGYDILQGSGDWTGIRWIFKYLIPASSNRIITKDIDMHIRDPKDVDIQKVNERFDATEATASYTLQETINRNENFIYWFFKQILGDSDSLPESLGKRIYEKISNFTSNNSDIDLCNMDSLISLSTQVGFDIKRYDYTYPGSIKRLIDLFSINHTRLTGTRDQSDDIFLKNGYVADFNHGRNMGDSISFDDYIINVGTRIIAMEMYNSTISLIEPMAIPGDEASPHWSDAHSGLIQYPLSAYSPGWGWGLSYPGDSEPDVYYEFFSYVPNTDYDPEAFLQVSGTIDWDNPMTTALESESSVDDFHKSGGVVDIIIDQRLRTGLELFK